LSSEINSQPFLLTELKLKPLRNFITGRLIWLSGLYLRRAKALHGWD
jgi:hypothetical protein